MILIDRLQRQETLARVRQRHRHRPGIKIEDRRRVQRVAIEPDDRLAIDAGQLPPMRELPEAVLRDIAEVEIALGPGEVVDGYRVGTGSVGTGSVGGGSVGGGSVGGGGVGSQGVAS